MNIVHWFKELNRIIKTHYRDITCLGDDVSKLRNIIKERTDIHADVAFHAKGQSQIIMIGRYARQDYIQIFTVGEGDFNYLVTQMREMQKYGTIKKIDCMPAMRETFKHELNL